MRQFTRRDGLIEIEGDVYRKTNGQDGILLCESGATGTTRYWRRAGGVRGQYLTQETRTVLEPVERQFGATVQSQESVKPVFRVRDEDFASPCLTLRDHHMVKFVKEEPERRKSGLLKIRGQLVGMVEEWACPVNTTLPMGWTGNVLLGQEVRQELFKRCVGRLEQQFQDVECVDVLDLLKKIKEERSG